MGSVGDRKFDQVILNFHRHGVDVDIVGLNKASATLVDKLAIHDKSDSLEDMASH